ncbi:MAG: ferritin family protein [Candidatus Riflebacteria bacterium]|nr:ferritin family protein [Candidatus Riflebacteria bacterium]
MDILEFAMDKEKEAETLYRELARKAPHEGFRNILLSLADQEAQHHDLVKALRASDPAGPPPQSNILLDATSMFQSMAQEVVEFNFGQDEIALYETARDLEEKERDMYLDKARVAATEHERQLLLRLADEEDRHRRLLDNVVDFLGRPRQWLENAEWTHLEPY